MITFREAGADTVLLSSCCSACPYAGSGCCKSPPRYDWSDIGRVVAHGGRDWLLAQLANGKIKRIDRGLALQRRKMLPRADGPREAACTMLGPSGCTIATERRPATCNYYLCDKAMDEGEASSPGTGVRARAIHDGLVDAFVRADDVLARRVAQAFPDGPPFDAAFLDWLGDAFAAVFPGGLDEGAPGA